MTLFIENGILFGNYLLWLWNIFTKQQLFMQSCYVCWFSPSTIEYSYISVNISTFINNNRNSFDTNIYGNENLIIHRKTERLCKLNASHSFFEMDYTYSPIGSSYSQSFYLSKLLRVLKIRLYILKMKLICIECHVHVLYKYVALKMLRYILTWIMNHLVSDIMMWLQKTIKKFG